MHTDNNFLEMLKKGLQERIHRSVENALVNDILSELEPQVREMVKKEVVKVTFEQIESLRDVRLMRNELRVFINQEEQRPDAHTG